jgi:hypothetical protein
MTTISFDPAVSLWYAHHTVRGRLDWVYQIALERYYPFGREHVRFGWGPARQLFVQPNSWS